MSMLNANGFCSYAASARNIKMHPIKALAVMCVGLTVLCYAVPMPSDLKISYSEPRSESVPSRREAQEMDVEDGDLVIALRA